MSRHSLVLNVGSGLRVGIELANQAVEACAAVWIERGKTFRDATPAEAIALRNHQAKTSPRLAYAELPGLVYEPSVADVEGYRREQCLVRSAYVFMQRFKVEPAQAT